MYSFFELTEILSETENTKEVKSVSENYHMKILWLCESLVECVWGQDSGELTWCGLAPEEKTR